MSVLEALVWLASLFAIYRAAIVVYRLYFHPLAKFPGPRLAAATTLYRAYYQVIRDGDHVLQATRLHERYGSIVRVSPNTIHFRDPKAFDDIFKFTSKFTKDPDFYDHLGQSEALFGMPNEEAHKERFKIVADLFSRKFAQTFESSIDLNADRVCALLLKKRGKVDGAPINLARGLRAVALDIIQDFVFDFVPDELRGLRDEEFDTLFVDSTWDVMDWTAWCFRNFPFALTVSNQLPQWVRKVILPGEHANIDSFDATQKLVEQNLQASPKWHRDSLLSRMADKVTVSNLTSECMGTMFGGVINLANMLPFGAFGVSDDNDLQNRLYSELASVWQDPNGSIPSYSVLHSLPLLTGVVKESLRLMHGIIVGPPRVVPDEGATICGQYVPGKVKDPNVYTVDAQCVVTTSSLYVHTNPSIFPEPTKFDPDRWANSTMEMEKSLVAFSKGRRMCPGKDISIMELYIVLAALFRRFEIKPHETTMKDFEWKVYVSPHFTGRFFHATLTPRDGYEGRL